MEVMLKEAFQDWRDDNAPRLGAALAYYAVFSLAPLLLIAIAIAGLVFGEEAARGQVVQEIQGLLGEDGAQLVEAAVENARKPSQGVLATVLGLAGLLFGASGAFGELKSALNTIWEVEPKKGGGLKGLIKDRLLSFAMVLVIGFLLLVSLIVSAALSAVGNGLKGFVPSGLPVLQLINVVVSLAVITALFAMLYKYVPDTQVEWRDVWVGAAMTSVLFTAGKFAIGAYLGSRNVGSAYGAAGSLVIVLVWVYYAAQILFFGAELTQVYATRHGSRIGASREPGRPREHQAEKERKPEEQRPPAPAPAVPAPAPRRRLGPGLLVSAGLLLLGALGERIRR
jgi:membrane protein